uniref:Cadherin-related family member 5 n=1 Tax=Catagonus wagneri TaxID=51154 RepID=A0A8C3W2R9_9CETA
MGAWPLPLLLLVAAAQAQGTGAATGPGRGGRGGLSALTRLQPPVCSVSPTFLELWENTGPGELLLNISVPEDQQVTLGPSSTPFAFRIQGTQLFLNVTLDYEENSMLQAHLECKRGDTVVSPRPLVLVSVLDVNDNPPVFPYKDKVQAVPEDTKVNTIVIPETELEAHDRDKDDVLFYSLQEVTPGASDFFSLVGANRPALRLDRSLDFTAWPAMTFQLLVQDTQDNPQPGHSATATLTLEVQPADLRPPWFLPCVYSDAHVCIQAQYKGAVPTGHRLPAPLVLRPGPVYAVDGDRGINQPIVYSIIAGHEDGTFSINADSGNLTMARSVSGPQTLLLLVKVCARQADGARYSVTQVTVEALDASGSPPRFPEGLYRGAVALGSGPGVAVQDAAAPPQPLRIWAQDPDFPDINSAIAYRITNNSNFRMDGEAVLTNALLTHAGLFYAEVEATNTATSHTATTVLEVQVSEQEPAPTGEPPGDPRGAREGFLPRAVASASLSLAPGPPGAPTPPETAETNRPASSTPSEAPRPPEPEPSQGPSSTSSGGGGPSPGATPRPPAPSVPGGPPSTGTGPSAPPASPGGDSGQTSKPASSPLTSPGLPGSTPLALESPHAASSPGQPGTSEAGGSSTATGSGISGGPAGDRRFSTVEMAALGGVLGALLLLALIALTVLVHKHYGRRLKCCSGKAPEPQPQGFDNKAFLAEDEANWAPAPSPPPSRAPPAPPEPEPPEPSRQSPAPRRRSPEPPAAAPGGGSPAAMRSILTKERRPEGGYKAVWFGEDIGAEADVVVLNTPSSEVDGAGDSGSEGGSDGGADAGVTARAPV